MNNNSYHEYIEILLLLTGFGIVAVSSSRLSKLFQKIHLPYITGLLFIGILSGPFVSGLIPDLSRTRLMFINDFALAFIAFAAGSELYLSELRSRIHSIKWMTVAQLTVQFLAGAAIVYLIAGYIPFMKDKNVAEKIAISLISGAIFVASSPASAIAVIKELRAKGPFTQTVMGVTVAKDFLVIILFGVVISFSTTLLNGNQFNFISTLITLAEILLSFAIGYLFSFLLKFILSIKIRIYLKTSLILLSGYFIYRLSYWAGDFSALRFHHKILIEPLVICIMGSFIVTNYTKYRAEFLRIIQDSGPFIYTIFFTYTGATMRIDVLSIVWVTTLFIFFIRFATVIFGSVAGGMLSKDPHAHSKVAWMPYITQAGVSLGLATVVADEFPSWGPEFATVIISVIIINQFLGPPLFKWALKYVKEDRSRAQPYEYDGIREALIFGYENQAVALSRQLQSNGWKTRIITCEPEYKDNPVPGTEVIYIDAVNIENLDKIGAGNVSAFITLLTDEENINVCELAYQHYGTKDLIVRLNDRVNFEKFHSLGALIVEPSTAIVSLMDHFVRSPQATSLLLGMQKDQDTRDIEIRNPDLHGIYLRDLRLPPDLIVLSVKRAGQMIISHGYTRLRLGDVITMVGTIKSLDAVSLRF